MHVFGRKSAFTAPSCPAPQQPFAVAVHHGSYVDLVPDGTAGCGFVPKVCLGDFQKNNIEKSSDDYYQTILSLTASASADVRIIPAIDLIKEKFHYFVFIPERLAVDSIDHVVEGCATEIETQNQSIFYVESIVSDVK
jgi:hypothetical protein